MLTKRFEVEGVCGWSIKRLAGCLRWPLPVENLGSEGIPFRH